MKPFLLPTDLILFQGDSITDAGRHDTADGLGTGYVALVAGLLQQGFPGPRVMNRGVGGDRTVELLNRWKDDCLGLKPDVLSIMIGVNDVWRLTGVWNDQVFVPFDDYVANLRRLLDQAKTAGISRFVLMSPTTIEDEGNRELARHLDERTEAVKALAGDYDAVYVPTRETQKHALESNRQVRWTLDGCHPTPAGHALIAGAWLQAVGV